MDSRERTFLALDHEEPDRIPVDFWASRGCKQKLHVELGLSFAEYLDKHDIDLRYIEGPKYLGPPLETGQEGACIDIWGVPRRTVELEVGEAVEYYAEVVESPLSKASCVKDIEDYGHWPSPDWFDYGVIEKQCDEIREKGRVVVFMGDRLNRIAQLKPAMYLSGVETIMMGMIMHPDAAQALFGRIKGFYLEYTERILEAANGKIDIVATGDDFGSQNGLLVSPGMWEEFIEQGFREFIDLIHSHDVKVMHHTCGAVEVLIPKIIDCGLDILQSVQPEAAGMDASQIKKRYGDKICFQGGISIQKTMPYGTADDVRNEVKHVAQILGKGGGYIFGTAHNIQADTPVENVEALIKAYHELGKY